MPTTYTDQFVLLDPANPGANGTIPASTLRNGGFDIIDENDDDLIDRLNDDPVDGRILLRPTSMIW